MSIIASTVVKIKNIIEDVNGLMVGLKEDDNPIVVMAKTKPI